MADQTNSSLFQRALDLGQKRRYAEAIPLLQALAADDYPEARLYLGRALHGLNDCLEAVQVLQTYLHTAPQSAEGHFFLGRSLLACGAAARAISHFHRARKLGYQTNQLNGLLGSAYLKAKNPDLAVETLQKAVEAEPQNKGFYIAYLNALFVQAIKLFHASDFDMARQILSFLVSSGVQGTTVHLYLAHALKELGRFDEALSGYVLARQSDPDDPVLTFLVVEMLFALGRKDDAQRELTKVEHLLPAGTGQASRIIWDRILPYQYFQKKDYRQALFYGLKNLKADPQDADLHLVVAESHHQLGQLDKAIGHYRQAVKKDPQRIEYLYGLLLVLWEAENFQEAYQEVAKILKMAPQDPTAHYYAVLSACKIGKPVEETLPALRELIHRRGADPVLFAALAEDYVRAGLDELALGWAKKCLKLIPDNRPILDLVIDLLPDYSDGDLQALLTGYLAFHGQDQEILAHLAHHQFARQDYKAAQATLLKLLALGRRTRALLRGLAFTYRWESNWADALLIYKDMLGHDAKDPEVLSGIVLCLVKTGRQQTALDFAQKALRQGGSSPLLRYHLGQIYLAVKDWSKALESFRTVLQDWPQHWQSVEKLAEVYTAMGDLSSAQKFRTHAQNMRQKAKK